MPAIEFIKYFTLLRSRDTYSIVGYGKGQCVCLQGARNADSDLTARIFNGILQQIADDVCQMYGVCRNQLSGHVKMRSNHDILSCGNVAETNQFLYRFTHIESTDIEWCMFIIGTRHISYFRQISRQVVNLKHGVLQHFVHSGLICAHGFIVEEGNTHFQCLHRTFQLMYHRVHKTLPHFIYLPLFQYRLDLVDKAADEHQHQQDASGELPHHLLK